MADVIHRFESVSVDKDKLRLELQLMNGIMHSED